MSSERLRAFIALTRPPNGILMFIAVLAGVALSNAKSIGAREAILSLITAYALNGSSMGLNDYFDREVDKVNVPDRPIPSGIIAPWEAAAFSMLLGVIGMASAALTSLGCLIVATLSYSAALTYNAKLKRAGLLGNLLVSAVVVAPFIYGSVMSDGYVSARLLTFAAPVFLSNTGREVIKGISDVEGDALRGVKSVARTLGLEAAARIGATLYLSAVAISPLPYLLGLVSWIYMPVVVVADIGFIYSAISILREPSPSNSLKVKRQTLFWMLIALLAFIAGSVPLI